MFKDLRLVILFDMFFSPSFKMTTSFANIPRTTVKLELLAQVNLYTKKDFKSSEIGSL